MRAFYDSKSKTIDDRGIHELLSDKAKYKAWLKVEMALAKAQSEVGLIPKEAANQIEEAAKIENIDFEEMNRIYEEIGHGFVPFLKVLVKACPKEAGKYVHYGITTQNVQQSGQLYVVKQVHQKFLQIIGDILLNLGKITEEEKNTVMPGRTHGRHAIPITFGYKSSVWISELLSHVKRMKESEKRVFQIMTGGAVGTYATMPEVGPTVQKRVAEILGMYSMDVPSRNIQIMKLEYIMNLQLIASSCHKMAEEVYQTSLEEIAELSEGFKEGTVGSSTMPHKVNPKLSKGIIANAQKLYSLSSVGLYSSVRPYEGDSSRDMVFNGIIEEALQLMTEILLRMEELTRTLVVHRARMKDNAWINEGLDNSEYLMMEMAKNLGKDEAHSLVYEIAMRTAVHGEDFLKNLINDDRIKEFFNEKEIEHFIDPENYTGLSSTIATEISKKAYEVANQLKKE